MRTSCASLWTAPVELTETRRENEVLRRELEIAAPSESLVGSSPGCEIYSLVEQIATSSASVLITGDRAQGKDCCPHNSSTEPRTTGVRRN